MDEPRDRRKPVRVEKEEERQRIHGLVAGPRGSSGLPSLDLPLLTSLITSLEEPAGVWPPTFTAASGRDRSSAESVGRVTVLTLLQRGDPMFTSLLQGHLGFTSSLTAQAQSPSPSPCSG